MRQDRQKYIHTNKKKEVEGLVMDKDVIQDNYMARKSGDTLREGVRMPVGRRGL